MIYTVVGLLALGQCLEIVATHLILFTCISRACALFFLVVCLHLCMCNHLCCFSFGFCYAVQVSITCLLVADPDGKVCNIEKALGTPPCSAPTSKSQPSAKI